MKLENFIELYELISEGIENISSRKKLITIRSNQINFIKSGFNKVAFDTRKIDQKIQYNPRRNLQNYNRSEQFISQAMSEKLISLSKLQDVLINLKEKYEKDPAWLDSKARVLLDTINNGLGKINGDHTNSQPSIGSLDYIEQLLDMRYRLKLDNINKLAESDIQNIILSKDENLGDNRYKTGLQITSNDIATKSYDSLIEKLFGGIKATKENKSVERTVTITIRDSFLE